MAEKPSFISYSVVWNGSVVGTFDTLVEANAHALHVISNETEQFVRCVDVWPILSGWVSDSGHLAIRADVPRPSTSLWDFTEMRPASRK